MPKNGKTGGRELHRQKVLLKKIVENPSMSFSKAMKEVGYSPGYATKPTELKGTDHWQKLVERYLPDKLLLRKNKQILTAEVIDKYIFPNAMSDEEIKKVIKKIKGAKLIRIQRNAAWARAYFTYPNFKVQKEGVELGYKVKGKLARGAPTIGQFNQFIIPDATVERVTG